MEAKVTNPIPITNKLCICRDCGKTFSITPEEQAWYMNKGYVLPERCHECRVSRRASKRLFHQSVMSAWFENKDAMAEFMAFKEEFFQFLKERHPDRFAALTTVKEEADA